MDKVKKCFGYNNDGTVPERTVRDRWSSNITFIIASIGTAIGLGNLWRFPYLCYKWGGATFFIPYLLCLFFLGIPMLILEFALGQISQEGNILVWNKLHPRLYGVGLATCVACYLIVIYYNVIISWALVLFFSGFYNPLPWSVQRTTNVAKTQKDCEGIYITQEYFYRDILHVYNEDCSQYDTSTQMGDGTTFQWQVWLCCILTWIICFFCVFQGVKLASKIVWVTVPLPVVLVFIMVMNGFTLKNSDYGFRMYLKGYENDQPPNIKEKLQSAGMWSEACAQIFFTLSICIGVMVSYASYNPKEAPLISNGFAVSLCNSSFSFFAGFAVFSTIGYLVGLDSPVSNKVSSIGLAFVAYPAAIETMPGSNFWTLLLAVTLFTLGIDSAFAMVEGTVTVVQDSKIGKKMSKIVIAASLCGIGAIFSTVFCFNWGFTFFDIIDHYLNVYLVLLMGILQSVAIGWYFCQDKALARSKPAALTLILMYYGLMLPLAWACYFGFPDDSWVGLPVIWGWNVLAFVISACLAVFVSGISFLEWYEGIFFSGVRNIALQCLATQKAENWHWFFRRFFEFWWCFSIKYIFPWAMYWLIVMTVQADTTYPYYGGYYGGWQIIGILFPLAGLVLFLVPLIFNKGQADGSFLEIFPESCSAPAAKPKEVEVVKPETTAKQAEEN